jgi:hypothetical protein
LRRASPLAFAALAFAACAGRTPQDDPTRMAQLRRSYDQLHQRLERAAATEPLVASAFADHGQVLLAIRSGLIEELAGNVARRYLDRVRLDVTAVKGHGSGQLGKQTLFGRLKVGAWSVSVDLGEMVGELRAGDPRVGLRGPDLIEIELPVEVQETEGEATLHFAWASAGLANVVCRDFELTRRIHGRVLAQRHVLSGALRLVNTGERLTATPVFPDRRVRLKMDLDANSWEVVRAALRSQNELAKCGLLMHPDEGLAQLKELAARGIDVRLPRSIFRTVSLPAQLRQTVKVNQHRVGLRLTAQSLRIETATLWSSVSVQVQGQLQP